MIQAVRYAVGVAIHTPWQEAIQECVLLLRIAVRIIPVAEAGGQIRMVLNVPLMRVIVMLQMFVHGMGRGQERVGRRRYRVDQVVHVGGGWVRSVSVAGIRLYPRETIKYATSHVGGVK